MRYSRRRRRQLVQHRNFLRNILITAFGVLSLYFFSQSSFFALTNIEVKGIKRLSLTDVKTQTGLRKGMNLFQVDLEQVKKRLLAYPLVEEVKVKRLLPHTILITLKEREPCALLLVKDCFLVLDKKGFCIDKVTFLNSYHLPIITGFRPASTNLGEGVGSKPALEVVLRALEGNHQTSFSEINFADSNNLVSYSRKGIPILLGGSENLSEKFQLAASLIGSLKDEENVEYLDLRVVEAPAIKYREIETRNGKKLFSES